MAVPTEELPILEAFINIRNKLTALKRNRSDYIRAENVIPIYRSFIAQTNKLGEVREEAALSSINDKSIATTTSAPSDTVNRTDAILKDVSQLLSLFFLTIGKSREAPATLCQLSIMKQLLDHMNESGVYTEADLQQFQTRLNELKDIIHRAVNKGSDESDKEDKEEEDKEDNKKEEDTPDDKQADKEKETKEKRPYRNEDDEEKLAPGLKRLLCRKLEICQRTLNTLVESLSVVSHELTPIHQRLIQIRRQLAAIAARPKPSKADVESLQEELRKIDSKRVDGKFLVAGGNVPDGQALLAGLLEENFEIVQEVVARQEDVAFPLKPIYDRLSEMRAQLERLVLTHRWTLRETDLYNFQVSLHDIDSMRVDGKFVDSEGNKPKGQLVLLYLLRRCYGLIYRLMSSSEPISEELMPIANKLSTIKRCLNEVQKHGGPFSARDLYPYQLALMQIERVRVDGKFIGQDKSVPEGQAILNAHLAESYEILQMLREMDRDSDEE